MEHAIGSESDTTHLDDVRWRIEMLASASGFPVTQGSDGFGVRFSGPGLNGRWISIRSIGTDLLAMKVPSIVLAEMKRDTDRTAPFEIGADGIVRFTAVGHSADVALRRAAALMRSLPDTPLAVYRQQTADMPTLTEVEHLAKQRVGQDIFRKSLEDYWGGKCSLTGLGDRALLRASHIKPWAECASDQERLDVHNGLLLAAHVDAAFDAALLTFARDGSILLSSSLSDEAKNLLTLGSFEHIRLTEAHQTYLDHHRTRFDRFGHNGHG